MEIKITIDENCYKKLEELKNLLSHKNPKLSYGELLLILSEEGLNKYDPRRKKIRKNKIKTEREQKKTVAGLEKPFTSLPEPTASIKESVTSSEKLVLSITKRKQKRIISRAIPAYLQKYIWERDGGKCSYVHRETKRRCSSKYLLQIDHIQPFALGGKTEKENLRLLCAAHNRYRK